MSLDFDVGIVGAGCIGAGIAAALSDTRLRVALIDQGRAGSSAYSGGVVRLYDPDPQLMMLAAYAISLIGHGPCGQAFDAALRRTGVIYRASLEEADVMVRALAAHGAAEHRLHPVTDRRVLELSPLACAAAGRINLHEPRGGLGDVRQAVHAMMAVVRHQGAVIEHTAVTAIHTADDGRAVLTVGGVRLRCRVVVIAAGGWAGQLLPTLSIQAHSIPLARLVASRPTPMPLIDASVGSYAIPLSDGIVQVGSSLRDVAATPDGLPPTRTEQAADAASRLAWLSGCDELAPVINVLPGFDAYSPDGHPLVGFADKASPIYLATAMCGLGYKFTPAVAEIARHDVHRRLNGDAACADGLWAWLSPARLGTRTPTQTGVQP